MSAAKIAGFLVAESILGAAAFAGFAWLVNARMGSPLDMPPAASRHAEQARANVPHAAPLTSLMTGALDATEWARISIEREADSRGARAMDAALRATAVAEQAAENDTGRLTGALTEIRRARHRFQNGNPSDALKPLHAASTALRAAIDAQGIAPAGPKPGTWDGYEGAVVINARGTRVGELVHVRKGASGHPEAVLSLGGARDVLGFWDIGGQRLVVPARHLVFGKVRTVGSVLVALPTPETSAESILDAEAGASDAENGRSQPGNDQD